MNNDACEKLYAAYYMRVFSYVMTIAGDRPLAKEITQETFFRAFTKLSGFRGESDELTWLCSIARNLFTDEKRRKARRGLFPENTASPGMEPSVVEEEDSFLVHLALHAMEESCPVAGSHR